MERNILDLLEDRIDEAVRTITDLLEKNKKWMDLNKELQAQIAEREQRIESLMRALEEQKAQSNEELLQKYRDTEEKLRNRIQSMLVKLDELRLLENR